MIMLTNNNNDDNTSSQWLTTSKPQTLNPNPNISMNIIAIITISRIAVITTINRIAIITTINMIARYCLWIWELWQPLRAGLRLETRRHA